MTGSHASLNAGLESVAKNKNGQIVFRAWTSRENSSGSRPSFMSCAYAAYVYIFQNESL